MAGFKHGTRYGYQKRGCRCELCRKTMRGINKARRTNAKKARADELAEGFAAYRRWLAMGGTPLRWKEMQEFTVATSPNTL